MSSSVAIYPGAFYPGQVYPGQVDVQRPPYRSHFIDDRINRSRIDFPIRKPGGSA